MIIVKTKNGDRFINDKAVTMVEHDRAKAEANVYGDKGYLFDIKDVEAVIYTNDAQPTQWNDEGSEIQRMQKSLDEQLEWGRKIRAEYMKMEQERDELKARIAQLESKADPDRWWPDNVDSAPVSAIILHVGHGGFDPGYGVRLDKVFEGNNIKTVGDLLRIGRRNFRRYRSVGSGSIIRIDNALKTLYDIKGW